MSKIKRADRGRQALTRPEREVREGGDGWAPRPGYAGSSTTTQPRRDAHETRICPASSNTCRRTHPEANSFANEGPGPHRTSPAVSSRAGRSSEPISGPRGARFAAANDCLIGLAGFNQWSRNAREARNSRSLSRRSFATWYCKGVISPSPLPLGWEGRLLCRLARASASTNQPFADANDAGVRRSSAQQERPRLFAWPACRSGIGIGTARVCQAVQLAQFALKQ